MVRWAKMAALGAVPGVGGEPQAGARGRGATPTAAIPARKRRGRHRQEGGAPDLRAGGGAPTAGRGASETTDEARMWLRHGASCSICGSRSGCVLKWVVHLGPPLKTCFVPFKTHFGFR